MPFLRKMADFYLDGGVPGYLAKREHDKERMIELTKLMESHPESADTIAELGKRLKLDLNFAKPSNSRLLEGESKKVAENPYTATESSIVRDVKPLGRGLTDPTMSKTDRYNTEPDSGNLPSQQFGPEQRPEIKDLMAQASEGRVTQDAEIKRKLGISTDAARAQAYGQGLGTGQAKHENAPTETADEVADINAKAQPNADAAGLAQGAQFDAVNTPSRQSAGARGAGMRAGAEASATSPITLAREKARADYQHDLDIDMETFKQGNNLTSATKTMMEGAQMVLPHVNNLRVMAEALDKAGYFGPIMSRVRELGAKAGTVEEWEQAIQTDPFLQHDRSIGQFATELGLMASGAARVHGGARGGGSPMMLNYMKGLLSDASSLDMFEGRMDALEGYMKGYAGGPHAAPQPTPTIDVDPVGQSAMDKLRRKNAPIR